MELAQLRAFVAASRERNIARAAESLRLTPSPVSRTVAQFEREVGGEVFARNYHDLELTLLGEQLLPVAVRALEDVDEIGRRSEGRARVLRIAATPWAPSHFIEQLERLASATGGEVDVSSGVSSRLLHGMRHGTVDLAVVHLPVTFAGIATRPLARYRFSVFADPTHQFGERTSVTLRDLVGTPILSMPESMQPTAMSAMTSRLTDAGLSDFTVLDLQDWFTVPQVLRRTGGVILGMRTAEGPVSSVLASGGLISIPLADGELEFSLGLAWPEWTADARVLELAAALHPRAHEPVEVIE
jgi:DNA-binding transcriptional LysR family regulator